MSREHLVPKALRVHLVLVVLAEQGVKEAQEELVDKVVLVVLAVKAELVVPQDQQTPKQ